jgi:hypothetical protein
MPILEAKFQLFGDTSPLLSAEPQYVRLIPTGVKIPILWMMAMREAVM